MYKCLLSGTEPGNDFGGGLEVLSKFPRHERI